MDVSGICIHEISCVLSSILLQVRSPFAVFRDRGVVFKRAITRCVHHPGEKNQTRYVDQTAEKISAARFPGTAKLDSGGEYLEWKSANAHTFRSQPDQQDLGAPLSRLRRQQPQAGQCSNTKGQRWLANTDEGVQEWHIRWYNDHWNID